MHDRELDGLENMLRQMMAGYNTLRHERRETLSDEAIVRLEQRIQSLAGNTGLTLAQRYRLNTLTMRYKAYRELWQRWREQNGLQYPVVEDDKQPDKAREGVALENVTCCVSISDPQAEEAKVRELYDAFWRLQGDSQADSGAGASPCFISLPWPRFFKYIDTRVRHIKEKSGCSTVTFTLLMTDRAVRFIAAAGDGGRNVPTISPLAKAATGGE